MNEVKGQNAALVALIPALDDRAAFAVLVRRLAEAVPRAHVVAVDDGSLRAPLTAQDIEAAGLHGAVLHLERNLGHQRAILVGLNWIAAHYPDARVAVLDADGEDEPAHIAELETAMTESGADAAVAERGRRAVPAWFHLFLRLYQAFFWVLTGLRLRHGNFSLLSPRAARRIARMEESWTHYGAALISARLQVARVTLDRGERIEGQSRMSLTSLVVHGMRSVIVFADRVLARTTLFAAGLAALCAMLLAVATLLKLGGMASPGWYTAASGLLVVMMIQSAMLALLAVVVAASGRAQAPAALTDPLSLIESVESVSPVRAKTEEAAQ